mgnify:CR=1 FL=1
MLKALLFSASVMRRVVKRLAVMQSAAIQQRHRPLCAASEPRVAKMPHNITSCLRKTCKCLHILIKMPNIAVNLLQIQPFQAQLKGGSNNSEIGICALSEVYF